MPIITCLIGSDPAVTVRPFWTAEPLAGSFLSELSEWADLHEMRLLPGELLLKLSRHEFEDTVFTWMALYVQADPYQSSRKHGFLGAGFFLAGNQAVPGQQAVAHLAAVVSALLDVAAPKRKLTLPISQLSEELLPLPPTAAALEFERSSSSGRQRAGAADEPVVGGILFVDISDPAQNARYMGEAQLQPEYRKYHTVLVGHPPEAGDDRILKPLDIVSHEHFAVGAAPSVRTIRRDRSGGHGGGYQAQPRAEARIRAEVFAPGRSELRPAELHLPSSRNLNFYRGMIWGIVGTAAFFLALFLLGLIFVPRLIRSPSPGETPAVSPQADLAPAAPAESSVTNPAVETVERFFADLEAGRDQEARDRWASRSRVAGFGEFANWYNRFSEVRVVAGEVSERPAEGAILRTDIAIAIMALRSEGRTISGQGEVQLRRDSAEADEAWYIDRISLEPPLG